ncbi:MAG: ABC transporter permease [Clostridia bacterium]|nr:ABC transporter permease [Clostridia bacterium]
MNRRWYSAPYLVWSLIFIVVPMLMVAFYGLTVVGEDGSFIFSLENIKRFFTPLYLGVLGRSALYAAISTVICIILGYPAALILSSKDLKHKSVMMFLIVIPMWMNLLLRTYSWLSLLENEGLINQFLRFIGILGSEEYIQFLYGEGAVIFGMVYNFLPFMILPIYSVMSKMDYSIINAAEDLGANKFNVFRKVIFPLSIPGISSGITMVFIPAITTFAISSILSGNNVNLLGNVIEKQFGIGGDWNFGSTMSLVLMIFILISMFVMPDSEKESQGGLII